MSSSVSSRHSDVVSCFSSTPARAITRPSCHNSARTHSRCSSGFVATRCRVRPLHAKERYRDASPGLRRLEVDVDAWPVAPAGLFVVEERTVYLRSLTPMTIGHEVAHAIDCALGDGVYRSGFDPKIRAAFAAARIFVTPYAASGLDEYFAECVRAYADVFNGDISPWPRATRERLQACDPAMHAIVAEIFATA